MDDQAMARADVVLSRWGELVRGGRSGGLGYPSCSAEQMAQSGSAGDRVPNDWPEEVTVCERAVLEMPSDMRKLAHARYVKDNALPHCASELRSSETAVKALLRQIRAWVASRLVLLKKGG